MKEILFLKNSGTDPKTYKSRPFELPPLNLESIEKNLDEAHWRRFNRLTSTTLSADELNQAETPSQIAPGEHELLAVHWHPEWVPVPLVEKRVKTAFPDASNRLFIPTQHNRFLTAGHWAGVEVDIYDPQYLLKVQLLIHLQADRLPGASALVNMVDRTYNYRAHQLLEILNRLIEPDQSAAKALNGLLGSIETESVEIARVQASRLRALIQQSDITGSNRDEMLKNRLLPDFISANLADSQRDLLPRIIMAVNAVKKQVKADLKTEQFYTPQEFIEEARGAGAGVVIPHPPIFWPILLSSLDVDGWEVWNPSTPKHTLFLIKALEAAQGRPKTKRPLLVFMGDDTHMSSKIRGDVADSGGLDREIGFQPPWHDPKVIQALREAGQSRTRTLNEYRERLT